MHGPTETKKKHCRQERLNLLMLGCLSNRGRALVCQVHRLTKMKENRTFLKKRKMKVMRSVRRRRKRKEKEPYCLQLVWHLVILCNYIIAWYFNAILCALCVMVIGRISLDQSWKICDFVAARTPIVWHRVKKNTYGIRIECLYFSVLKL